MGRNRVAKETQIRLKGAVAFSPKKLHLKKEKKKEKTDREVDAEIEVVEKENE